MATEVKRRWTLNDDASQAKARLMHYNPPALEPYLGHRLRSVALESALGPKPQLDEGIQRNLE